MRLFLCACIRYQYKTPNVSDRLKKTEADSAATKAAKINQARSTQRALNLKKNWVSTADNNKQPAISVNKNIVNSVAVAAAPAVATLTTSSVPNSSVVGAKKAPEKTTTSPPTINNAESDRLKSLMDRYELNCHTI